MEISIDMEAVEKIKFLRNNSRYTQKELAELSNISFRSIQQYEAGNRKPKQDKLEKMAEALNIPVQCFLSLNDLITNQSPFLLSLPINQRIRTIRLSAGYDVTDFATTIVCYAAGTDSILLNDPVLKRCKNEIKAIEDGMIQPEEGILYNIAGALNIPIDILIDREPEQPDNNLLHKINQLNDEGKQRLDNYIDDLLSIDKYRK